MAKEKVVNIDDKKSKEQHKKKPTKSNTKPVKAPQEVPEKKAVQVSRTLNDDVIREHMLIRRSVNITYIGELSRLFNENAAEFQNAFLSIFDEKQQAEIAQRVNIGKVEIATYETIAAVAIPNSPLKNINKSLYTTLRDIGKAADGCEDENIPAEVVTLTQYINKPKYIVIRESAFVYGIDTGLNDLRKISPTIVASLTALAEEPNPVVLDLLLLHLDAWIPGLSELEFVTDEKIKEYLSSVLALINGISCGALVSTYVILTSSPNTDIYNIIQSTNYPNYCIQTMFSFNGSSIIQIIDEKLETPEKSVEELLADDGMAEDDKTLMDVIDEEDDKPAPPKKKGKSPTK